MGKTKILGIILIILAVLIISVALIINLFTSPEQKEKQQANNKLNTDQMLALLKYAQYHLERFDENKFLSDEYMIVFALDYLGVTGENEGISSSDEYITVKRDSIEAAVRYIFNKEINYSNIPFRQTADSILVPIYPIGTDAQIYKFKSREYNEATNVYTVYIDCLEIGPSRYSEIIEGSVTEYDEEDVLRTLVFEYKEMDGRRVLVGYNVVYNF